MNIQEEFISEEYEDSFLPQQEFQLLNSVIGDGIQKEKEFGLNTVSFDNQEELLWIGTKSGHVTSYFGPQLQKYTSFQVHPRDQVRNIITLDSSILVLTNSTLRSQHRRGYPLFTYSGPNFQDLYDLILLNRSQRVILSGIQDKLVEFDLNTCREVSVHDTQGSCAILREHPRFICCGEVKSGKVQLRDPRSLKQVHNLEAHSGGLSDFDVHGHQIITCGHSVRHGIEQTDRFLMVYDLRILRAVNPIQSLVMPYQIKFIPSMPPRIAIMSSLGHVQMADTACLSTPNFSAFNVDIPHEGVNTISMAVSPSNSCLAFGDTSNTLYLYSSVMEPAFGVYSRGTEFADPVEQLPPIAIDDETAIYSSVPRPHLPPEFTSYLSDMWPEKFQRPGYRPTPSIGPEILNTMKIIGTVGYARNDNASKPRNLVSYPHVLKGAGRAKEKKKHATESFSIIPFRYRKLVVKYSKMGVDDFDFDRYNCTNFCGLEASLPNAYSNSMLQILYYSKNLRLILMNHGCKRETCIVCELSFLFHMMDNSPGMPCASSNFLRSLRTIPEASALGIILSEEGAIQKANVPRLIQSWNRFILQQILAQCSMKSYFKSESEEFSSQQIKSLFGMKQDKINTCSRCNSTVVSRDSLLVANLVYPELQEPKIVSFNDIICSSLCPEQTTPAWCEKCRKYQITTIYRAVRSLPMVLSLNAGCDNPQDISWLQTQFKLLLNSIENNQNSKEVSECPKEEFQEKKNCRYGSSCNRRAECKFQHPENVSDSTPIKIEADPGDLLFKKGISYFPSSITLRRHEDGSLSYPEMASASESPISESRTYDLHGICSNVQEDGVYNNLVACVNVGPEYHTKSGSPVSQWYIFNDFIISAIRAEEATWFDLSWKTPCVFTYQATKDMEISPLFKDIEVVNPIDSSVFDDDRSLLERGGGRKRITFMPLAQDEVPQNGFLVAIDAEFVTLNQEESELRSDGKVSLLKGAHMSVARITCVRGQGTLEGFPFIDDYITTQEQVVDYLTKFSGIKPGDLDAHSSSKHLTTLKAAYKKLRYLVDSGVTFVGHGLKNDFRVINIVVPPEQVVDTVHLFHLPHNRMVSLKFLAWFFLNKNIQGDTHDSIEDAVTALALYKKYLRLKEDNSLAMALNSLYSKGKEMNWKVPENS